MPQKLHWSIAILCIQITSLLRDWPLNKSLTQRWELDLRYLILLQNESKRRLHAHIWSWTRITISPRTHRRYRKSSSIRWVSQIPSKKFISTPQDSLQKIELFKLSIKFIQCIRRGRDQLNYFISILCFQ